MDLARDCGSLEATGARRNDGCSRCILQTGGIIMKYSCCHRPQCRSQEHPKIKIIRFWNENRFSESSCQVLIKIFIREEEKHMALSQSNYNL